MALVAVATSLLAACGGAAHLRPVRTAVADNTTPAVRPAKPSRPHPLPAGTGPLRAALNGGFSQAGSSSGGAVYDLTDHVSLYALREAVGRPPASVEKLYTSVAVLNKLGPSATLQTRVLGAGYLGAGGVWHGNLYLRGGGDPTFGDSTFNHIWEHGYGPTASQLVGQLQRDGISSVTGRVVGDGVLFDTQRGPPSSGFAPDIPDLGGQLSALTYDHGATGDLTPPAFAARQLARTMRAAHLEAGATKMTGAAPIGARVLATVSSPPMSVLLRLMDVPSDDFFAEMLAKQLGARFGGTGTTAAGARVISEVLAGYDIHPGIVDGSGLSRSDRSSPRGVVELLDALHGTPTGAAVGAALPTVGVDGTVQTIASNTIAKGRCIAKTGTLENVTNLAGYCHSAGDKLLAFALFIDGPSNGNALTIESRMIAAIARL